MRAAVSSFVNLTPHEIVVRLEDGTEHRFPPSGTVARVTALSVPAGTVNGLPAVRTTYGEITGLSDSETRGSSINEAIDGTIYIVSSVVLAALWTRRNPGDGARRHDVVAPDTGPESAIRDEAGRIVAVGRFLRATA